MAKKRSYGVELLIKGKDLASPTLNRVGRSLKLLTSPIRSLGRLAKGLGGLIEKVPGLAILGSWVGSLAGHFKELALSAATYADTLDNLRNHTGINAKAIQSVAFAADHAGVPFEQFSQGLRKMTEVLGRGVQASQFNMLGKGARGFIKSLKGAESPTEKFELILAQMAAIPDTAKRAAFGMTFFSEPGVKLAAIATNGADGIRQMRIEAERLGIVMSDEDISKADQFADSWANIGKLVDSTKRDFGSGLVDGLLPALKDLLQYARENRKEIGAFIKELGRKVGTGIVDSANAIVSAVKWIVDHKDDIISVAKNVGIALAALTGLKILGGIGGILGVGAGAAGGAAAGAGAAAAAGGAQLGAMGLAGAVAGPALAAVLLPDQGKIDGISQRGRFAKDEHDRYQRIKILGNSPGIFDIASQQNQRTPEIYEGFVKIADMIDKAAESTKLSREMVSRNDAENRERLRMARTQTLPESLFMSGGNQSVEVKVVIEDKGGNTDGDPKVKAPGGAKVSAVTKGNTGRRSQVYADGGR